MRTNTSKAWVNGVRLEQLDFNDPGQRTAFEELIQDMGYGMPYHSPRWLDLLETVLPQAKPSHLGVFELDALVGAFPSFQISPDGAPTVLNSLPFFGSHGGLLARPEHQGKVADLVTEHLNARGSNELASVTIVTPLESNSSWFKDRLNPDFIDDRIAQILEIPGSEEGLMEGYSRERRNNVRQARRKGVTVETGTTEKRIGWLKEQHKGRMEAIGGRRKPDAFFSWVLENATSNFVETVWAYLDGQIIGGMILFQWGSYVEYYLPAFDIEYSEYNPLPLIIHESILGSDQAQYWNFGGTREGQEGVHRFKRQFGADEVGYEYLVNVYDQTLLEKDPNEVLDAYPYWYVYPFDQA